MHAPLIQFCLLSHSTCCCTYVVLSLPLQGYAADHYGDCAIWLVVGLSFVVLWIVLLPIYANLHPVTITNLNGSNAIKGPTGYSTGCRAVAIGVIGARQQGHARPATQGGFAVRRSGSGLAQGSGNDRGFAEPLLAGDVESGGGRRSAPLGPGSWNSWGGSKVQ